MTDPTQDKPGSSAATLMPLVYDELRRLARAHLGGGDRQTLQATALVNEAYLKLTEKSQVAGCSHEEFVRLAARVMRNVNSVACCRDGTRFASAGDDGMV